MGSANFTPPSVPHDYKERVNRQTLSWAMGRPYHDKITDECCPDFSCCIPDLFNEDAADRWRHYRDTVGRAAPTEGEA